MPARFINFLHFLQYHCFSPFPIFGISVSHPFFKTGKIRLSFLSSRRRHTRYIGDWSSDVCSSDLQDQASPAGTHSGRRACGWNGTPSNRGDGRQSSLLETDRPIRRNHPSARSDLIKPHQREPIPAVVHADGTGRLQTVETDVNPLYWKLIDRFGEITGVPVLLNTSFNENEPVVNNPAQAIDCFLRTKMDALAIGSFILLKSENLEQTANRHAFGQTVVTA